MKNRINFRDMVITFTKPGKDVIDGLTPASANLLHMAVGISSEVGKLIEGVLEKKGRSNTVEKLGEIEFYVEGISIAVHPGNHYGSMITDNINLPGVMLKMSVYASAILDAAKKSAIHELELDTQKLLVAMDGLTFEMSNFRAIENINRQECINANVLKLGKRYGDGSYSNKQAQLRADKQ